MNVTENNKEVIVELTDKEMQNLAKQLKFESVDSMLRNHDACGKILTNIVEMLDKKYHIRLEVVGKVSIGMNGDACTFIFSKNDKDFPIPKEFLENCQPQMLEAFLEKLIEEIENDPEAMAYIEEKMQELDNEYNNELNIETELERPILYEFSDIKSAYDTMQFIKEGDLVKKNNKYYLSTYYMNPTLLEFSKKETAFMYEDENVICHIENGVPVSNK